jgi:hypothetical protein
MDLNANEHKRVTLGYYGAGHMMYIQDQSLGELKKDVSAFVAGAMK